MTKDSNRGSSRKCNANNFVYGKKLSLLCLKYWIHGVAEKCLVGIILLCYTVIPISGVVYNIVKSWIDFNVIFVLTELNIIYNIKLITSETYITMYKL